MHHSFTGGLKRDHSRVATPCMDTKVIMGCDPAALVSQGTGWALTLHVGTVCSTHAVLHLMLPMVPGSSSVCGPCGLSLLCTLLAIIGAQGGLGLEHLRQEWPSACLLHVPRHWCSLGRSCVFFAVGPSLLDWPSLCCGQVGSDVAQCRKRCGRTAWLQRAVVLLLHTCRRRH